MKGKKGLDTHGWWGGKGQRKKILRLKGIWRNFEGTLRGKRRRGKQQRDRRGGGVRKKREEKKRSRGV